MRVLTTIVCMLMCPVSDGDVLRSGMMSSGTFSNSVTTAPPAPSVTNNLWFVDAIGGSDSNNGYTTNAPFLSPSAMLAALYFTNAPPATNYIYFKRGTTNFCSFHVPTNSVVDGEYWGAGSMAVFDGGTNLANAGFSLVAGKTFTYGYPMRVLAETNLETINLVQSNVLMVIQNGIYLLGGGTLFSDNAGFGSVSNVEANTGSWWYDNANSILYVHPLTNNNPTTDGNSYNALVRTLGFYGGNGFLVKNMEIRNVWAYNTFGNQGYPAFIGNGGDGTYLQCDIHDGWDHLVGFANNNQSVETTYRLCTIHDQGPGDMAIGYKGGTVSEPYPILTLDRCHFWQSSWHPTTAVAVYGHSGQCAVRVRDCIVTNMGIAFDMGGTLSPPSDLYELSGTNIVIDCNSAVAGYIPLGSVISNLVVWGSKEGAIEPDVSGHIDDCAIINSLFINCAYGLYGETIPGAGILSFTNDIFAYSTNFIPTGRGFDFNNTNQWINSFSNTFYNLAYGYQNGGSLTNNVKSSDYNNFYANHFAAQAGSDSYAELAQFRAAYSQYDIHSTTNNPGFAGSFFNRPAVGNPLNP